jgi:hypothetical protein
MKFLNAVVIVCALMCLRIDAAWAAATHSVKGVVITKEGTVVPEFSVIVRHEANKPALFPRMHFKNGEFTVDGLTQDKYVLQITAPLFVPTRLTIDFTADPELTNYPIVILHTFRNEARVTAGSAYSVSVKKLQEKIPPEAAQAYAKAVDLHREGKLEEALIEYGKTLRAYPQHIGALTDLGSTAPIPH